MSAFAQFRYASKTGVTNPTATAASISKDKQKRLYEELLKLFVDEYEMEFFERRIKNRIEAMQNGENAPAYLVKFQTAVKFSEGGTNRQVCEHAADIFVRMVGDGKSSSVAAKTALKEGTRLMVLLEDHLESSFSVDGLRSTIKLNEVQQGQNLQLNSLSGEQTSGKNKST
jgi:hypothetical protein